jgi:hypothetical protein
MNAYMWKDNSYNHSRLGIDKLGQLEDIEEELGVDLIKLLKAKTTFYKRDNGEIEENDESFVIDLEEKGIDFVICGEIDEMYMFADYGKTWAFTKEEIKNDRV